MSQANENRIAVNKRIAEMSARLRQLLPSVLVETGIDTEASLNAKIGMRASRFIDLRNAVITSPEHYASLYLEGFRYALDNPNGGIRHDEMFRQFKASKTAQEYLLVFLERSYLKHIDEYSKHRPKAEEAELWIGQNAADYGLLVSPRFSKGKWENDQSEIRHFRPLYWTIGHVVATGLVIPGKEKKHPFADVDAYLNFFENVLVRQSRSNYQIEIAARYSDYAKNAPNPLKVPLLIPELRYEGCEVQHKYRLDFCVIDPLTFQKTGFELSPWSSHGNLTATKGKTQRQINEEASNNYEREMAKHKAYFRKYGIFALIYTDRDLADLGSIFDDIKECLEPKSVMTQLNFHLLSDFFK